MKLKPAKIRGHWDVSLIQTLFQDPEGTIPVTAVGQPVACIKDSLGSNNSLYPSHKATLALDEGGRFYVSMGLQKASEGGGV